MDYDAYLKLVAGLIRTAVDKGDKGEVERLMTLVLRTTMEAISKLKDGDARS